MLVFWISLVLILIFLIAGLVLVNYVFVRKPFPDVTDPVILQDSQWVKYEKTILPAAQWLRQQPVKPLQVLSYDNKLLYGRFVPCENAKATILFFHGYRSSYAVDFSGSMKDYHDQGYNLLLVDQRAHGLSQGRYITFGIKERYDVLSWVTYLSMMLGDDHPMFLCGLSMGATTVCMAADMEFPANIRGIIADCGFTSPGDILRYLVKERYHLPPKPVVWLLNVYARLFAGFGLEAWSTKAALEHTRLPVAFFHGLDDKLVPDYMSRESFEACAGEKVLLEVPGADHGTSYLKDKKGYQQTLAAFLEIHLKDRRP